MDEDLGFSAKSQPKKGRRAKVLLSTKKQAMKEASNENVAASESSKSIKLEDEAPAPRPSRRQLGWDKTISNEDFDSRFEIQQISDEENDDDIQNIPDLDEIHEDDITQEIAAPPTVYTSKIASYG